MPEEQSWREVGRTGTGLALAVSLRDDLTGDRPRGDPRVTIDGEPPDARSASGYHLCFDRPDDPVEVAVEAGEDYVDDSESVPPDHDPATPVTFDLLPTTAYALPSWATAIRGRVHEDDDPVAGAGVSVDLPAPPSDDADPYERLRDRTVRTNAAGEFCYAVPGAASIASDDGATLAIDGSDPTIVVALPDGSVETEVLSVERAGVTRYDLDVSE